MPLNINQLSAIGVSLFLAASTLGAADFTSYRGFRFGASVASTAKLAGTKPTEVRVIHQRPARIEELEWRPNSTYQAGVKKVDPVREGLFRFLDGELFQIVSTYDREKVEGMTEADMVTAISATYGPATKPDAEVVYHSSYGETAQVLARWEDAGYSFNLIQTGDRASFALVLSQKRLDALATAAIAESTRLDVLEAPQKAIDLEKKQEVDSRLLLNKARAVNMPNFKP